jgi:NAD(P)H dehydrogenase (quinone)
VHLLAVFAHPERTSFTGAVLDRFTGGAREAGHEVEELDLYRSGFDPLLRGDDYAQFRDGEMPADVRAEQARVDRAEGLVLVFPVWWWSFPAVLKGWFDRVFSQGWAYDFTPGRSRGLLADRPTLLLGIGGSRASTYRRYGYDEAMRTQIDVGMLGYCGLRDVQTVLLHEADDDAAARQEFLDTAHRLGLAFPGERVSRDREVPPAERPS